MDVYILKKSMDTQLIRVIISEDKGKELKLIVH